MLYGRIIGVVAVLAMGAAFVVGCGDDGEASANVTKAEFIKEAEAVCQERKENWIAEGEVFTKEREEVDKLTNKRAVQWSKEFFESNLVPVIEEEQAALEELEVPEEDAAEIEKMLEGRARGVEEVQEGGLDAMLGEPFKTFEKEAKAYGLTCTPFA